MKRNFRKKPVEAKKCPSCGAIMKKRTRKNYPFGRKSKSIQVNYYKCVKCGEKN
jgi:YgiT-type zinc finger domain-containing protein